MPFEVVNDGEVTALAGSMSMGENGVLGISMGTSVAGGYVTTDGSITPWLNELAFVPIDYRDNAPVDEWSGDRGCAVQYFCQQGVARLAPLAGLKFPPEMKFTEQLVEVQNRMAAGDERARRIYETIGVCFGYTIAHLANFYDIRNLLSFSGHATSSEGGAGHHRKRRRRYCARNFPRWRRRSNSARRMKRTSATGRRWRRRACPRCAVNDDEKCARRMHANGPE